MVFIGSDSTQEVLTRGVDLLTRNVLCLRMNIKTSIRTTDEHMIDAAARLVGGRGILADKLGVSVAAIGNWKVRGVPIEHCSCIELATHGAVTRKDLRPDDWQKIWPELAEAPANHAPAAIKTVADGVAGEHPMNHGPALAGGLAVCQSTAQGV
jgi:DNA-binding transcriptional regulator YdaS (Cro superfamily)